MSRFLRLFLAFAAVHLAFSAGAVALLARTAPDGTSGASAALALAVAVLLFPLGYLQAWLPDAPWLWMALNSLLWGGVVAAAALRWRRRG